LERGGIRQSGPTSSVLAAYHDDLIEHQYPRPSGLLTQREIAVGLPGRFGSGAARIEAVRLLDAAGVRRSNFERGERFAIEIDYTANPEIEAVDCMIPVYTSDVTFLTLWRAERDGQVGRPRQGRGRFRLEIEDPPILPGRYGLTISLTPPGRPYEHYDVLYKLFHFSIASEEAWETAAPLELKPRIDNGNPPA
jgi:hypothetical protein